MATIRTSQVPLPVNGPGANGYLAQPADDAKHPGIVLIQEWWGVDSHIIDLAQKMAAQGFVTLVPDLYHGQVATEPDDARRIVMQLRESIETAMQEIHGALKVLMDLPEVDPKKMGIIGFCFGGGITYRAAERFPEISVAVPFYGGGYDPTLEDLANSTASVLAFYGEADAGIPAEQRQKIETVFKAAGRDFQMRVFPGGHAFLNPTHGGYHADSAKQAWGEAIAFLKEHLR